jgi:hypothetical protein
MSRPTSDREFYTLAEVQEFLCENCQDLLPSASLFARRKIQYKIWHQEVPEPEEIVHIVFEKYWSGSRKMRKTIVPRTQVFLAIASVLSNLATHSKNRRTNSLFTPARQRDARLAAPPGEFEDRSVPTPDQDLSSREEREQLLDLLQGNELDHQVLEFILERPETSARDFRHAVRPRVIASELRVSRQQIYRSLERMRKVFESLDSCSDVRKKDGPEYGNDFLQNGRKGARPHHGLRIPSRPRFMERHKSACPPSDDRVVNL